MRRKLRPMVLILLALSILSGCAGARTLIIDARYDTARKPNIPFPAKDLKVALVPFEEAPEEKIGQWVRLVGGKIDRLVLKQPAEDVISNAIADYFVRAGFDVRLSEKGDNPDRFVFVPHQLNAVLPDFVVSGTVDRFSVDAESFVGFTLITAQVKLKVRVGSVKDGSFIMESVESIAESKITVGNNLMVFEEIVNEALADGMDQILQRLRLEQGVLRAAN